ncbi:hypothetical protein LX81_00252 [Palleronia aestuarii]|uniref:Uncharacterized protein n=1 Tax=Palleronia aestuarii TaxID=568105 RepID=A0A2W7NIU3_9RHOB|nr:hypothetical protein [Palleronia aestuarii]PZX19790.1 hypothetical protein LX81_00252 [Palleronia aestuarii]
MKHPALPRFADLRDGGLMQRPDFGRAVWTAIEVLILSTVLLFLGATAYFVAQGAGQWLAASIECRGGIMAAELLR